jgi:hypothetical protein
MLARYSGYDASDKPARLTHLDYRDERAIRVVWHLRKLFAWDMEHSVDCCQATMVPCPRRAP